MEWATGDPVEGAVGAGTAHTDNVWSVATAVVDGRAVAVTGGDEGAVLVWDLACGERLGDPLPAGGSVWAVATTVVEGRPVVVVADPDVLTQAWDLIARRPLAARAGGAWAVTTAVVDGRAMVLTGGRAPSPQMWDPATAEPSGHLVGDSAEGHVGAVGAMATALVDNRAKAFTLHDDSTVRGWDLTERRQEGRVLSMDAGDPQRVSLTVVVVDGCPLAVTGDWNGRVQVWDVDTGREVVGRWRPTPHTGPVWALAATVVDDRPLVVTGGDDRTVRVWDLSSHRQVGSDSAFPSAVTAVTMAPDGRVVVGYGGDVAVLAPLTPPAT